VTTADSSHLVEMAWQDRISFDEIKDKFGLTENQVTKEMRSLISKKSFKRWRRRVSGRKTKHKQDRTHRVKRQFLDIENGVETACRWEFLIP
jgi:uncharacterized protein (TIGR03643 family)